MKLRIFSNIIRYYFKIIFNFVLFFLFLSYLTRYNLTNDSNINYTVSFSTNKVLTSFEITFFIHYYFNSLFRYYLSISLKFESHKIFKQMFVRFLLLPIIFPNTFYDNIRNYLGRYKDIGTVDECFKV